MIFNLTQLILDPVHKIEDKSLIVPIEQIEVRQDEDGAWIAKSKLLPGCHAQDNDRVEAILIFQEAAKDWTS